MRHAIVIEKADHHHSAYAPDLPGCAATADAAAEVERRMREAISFDLEGLHEDDLPGPAPASTVSDAES